MNQAELELKLLDIEAGQYVFVSYVAGRDPTPRAIRESVRSEEAGISRRHFTGLFERAWLTRKGDLVFSVFCDDRDDERHPEVKCASRTFNPNLGRLLLIEPL